MLDAQTLMHQAATTANDYMLDAITSIDREFGPGYAKEHPALVAAYMQTAALDFMAIFGLQGIQEAIDRQLSDIAGVLDRHLTQPGD